MSQTHWKKLTSPDYIGAYALDPGKDLIVTIKSVGVEKVIGTDGKKEECTVAHFMENVKPMILNTTNAKTIEKLYHTPYIEEWAGRKIQLYVARVKAFGDVVDALRIRDFIPRQATIETKCADCGAEIQPAGKLNAQQVAQYTYQKYGKPLCSDCATKAKAAEDAQKITDPLAAAPDKPQDDKPQPDKPQEDEIV